MEGFSHRALFPVIVTEKVPGSWLPKFEKLSVPIDIHSRPRLGKLQLLEIFPLVIQGFRIREASFVEMPLTTHASPGLHPVAPKISIAVPFFSKAIASFPLCAGPRHCSAKITKRVAANYMGVSCVNNSF